jgi:trehalose 6-phosphate phosphatase
VNLLAPLREAPGETALLFDVDGTLAPIAPRPELARVPDETKAELERLVGSYRLVACISGRKGSEAEALVGVAGILYVGNHGLELDERAAELAVRIAAFRDSVALSVEDKGFSLSYHYRGAEDEEAAVKVMLASAPVRNALYAGDDTTDIDAFHGLAQAGLDHAVRLAVRSHEGPEALVAAADLTVAGPEELSRLLATL